MKFFRYIMPLIVMLTLFACSTINDATGDTIEMNGDVLKAEISHIVDGDTISIKTSSLNLDQVSDPPTLNELEKIMNEDKKLNVRFLAVDTPEISNGKNERFGNEARDLVDYMLSNGEVWLEIDEKALFDDYGRLLAHVFTPEGENVQLALLKKGLARIAYLYDDYEHVSDYEAAEDSARSEKLNIHSIEGYVTDRGFNMDVVDDD